MFKEKIPVMLRGFLPLAAAITLIIGLVYLVAQQVVRQGANDPQIQMAEDAAAALSAGNGLPEVPAVDIATSLAPYLIVFDTQGNPVSGSTRLHGNLPTVPPGTLFYAQQHGQNRVTWQPERGVRSAAVIVPVKGAHPGYVLAGRSLAETERRTNGLISLVAAGWLITIGATLVVVVLVNLL